MHDPQRWSNGDLETAERACGSEVERARGTGMGRAQKCTAAEAI